MVLERYMRKEPIYDSVPLENGEKLRLRRPTFRELENFHTENKDKEISAARICAMILKAFCDDPAIAITDIDELEKESGGFPPRDIMSITQWFYKVQGIDMKSIAEELAKQDFR